MAGPVKVAGVAAGSSAWAGLVLENGGSIVATWTEIRGANLAVSAKVGSKYSFDHLVVENSQAMFVLASTGTVSHATWTGLGPSQNVKPVLIHSASPKFTDSAFDNGEKGSPDIVNVDGATSAASFDHLEVTGTHCAFHFDFGSGCSITNSYIHDNSYALMIQSSTNTKIEHNSFEGNSVNLGDCSGGSVVATGNYFQGPVFNKSCGSQTSTDNKPAPLTDVGPRL
jgi:parallel beta-helix repeat protein